MGTFGYTLKNKPLNFHLLKVVSHWAKPASIWREPQDVFEQWVGVKNEGETERWSKDQG